MIPEKARIIEIFHSLSGEGVSAGVPTIFIRLAGCSLRCGKIPGKKLWCDTTYALSPDKGTLMTIQEVMDRVVSFGRSGQILITGGEPLEGDKKNFVKALSLKILKNRNFRFQPVRIETNGAEDISGLKGNVFSIDYKLSGSGMNSRMLSANFNLISRRKNPEDEVKFVVRNRNDFEDSLSVISRFKLENCNLAYSPVYGELEPVILAEWIKKEGTMKSRLSLQVHKILWGNQKGV